MKGCEPMAKSCDGCNLCCHIVPVRELNLKAWQGCPHVRGVPMARPGCAIYPTRPNSCAMWNCQWLAEEQWPDKYRPDRVHVAVDIIPDVVKLKHPNGKIAREMPVWQFWVERGHEDDWREPSDALYSLIYSCCQGGKSGVIWRTYDPERGQAARVFWLQNGKLATLDGGEASGAESIANVDRALELLDGRR